MSYDKINTLLKNLPVTYNGVKVKYKGIEKNTLRPEVGDNLVLDLVYEYRLDDVKKPFIIFPLIDDKLGPLVRKFLKYLKVDLEGGSKYREQFYKNYHGFRIVIDLIYKGQTHRIHEYGSYQSDFSILMGSDNEKHFTKTYNGNLNTNGGNLEYTISYEPGKNGLYHMVDDNSIYLRPNINISDITFTCDYSIDEPKLTEELVKKIEDVNEEIIIKDELPVTLLGFVPHDPLKIKMSELTKSFLEILFFITLEEGSHIDMESASPAHGIVASSMYPLLEDIDDSYCRPSLHETSVDGEKVKGLKSYWPDSVHDAHSTFLTCLAVDYIKNEGIIDELRSEGLIQ